MGRMANLNLWMVLFCCCVIGLLINRFITETVTLSSRVFRWIFGILLSFFMGSYGTLSWVRFYQLRCSRIDIGAFTAIQESLFVGDPAPFVTFGTSHFSIHVSPTLVLLHPFYRLFPFPETLLLLQVLFQGLAVFPLYFLAKKRLPDSSWPWILSFLYLLHPLHSNILLFDFHEITLFPFFFFSFLFFAEKRCGVKAFFCFILTLGIQETLSLSLFFFCLWWWRAQLKSSAPWIFIGLSLVWFLLVFLIIMPYFGGIALIERYSGLGATPIEIIQNLILHPSLGIERLWSFQKLQTILMLVFPLALLPCLSIHLVIVGVPLLIHLLSSLPDQALLRWHYSGFVLPFLMIASLMGLETQQSKKLTPLKNNKRLWASLSIGILCNIFFTIPFSESYFKDLPQVRYRLKHHLRWFSFSLSTEEYEISEDWKVLLTLKASVPLEASIGIQNNVGGWFGEYPKAYALGTVDCDFYLIHPMSEDHYDGTSYPQFIQQLSTIEFQKKYRCVFSDERFFLFQKR